mgnify:CR=1 FL=1
MNMIRTTVSLREDVYDNLRRLAAAKRMSLSGVVNAKLAGGSFPLNESEVRQKIKESREFFKRLAKSGKPGIDVTKAVREMRDGRMEQIVRNTGI